MASAQARSRVVRVLSVFAATVVILGAGGAWAANPFVDIANNTHADDIDAIYNARITSGCDGTHYCPSNPVTRDQMATFLARTAALSANKTKHFPVVNAKGATQAYCALVAASPAAFKNGPCATSVTAVDKSGQVGSYSSIAIGSDGLPVMSYVSGSKGLKVAHCANLACEGGTTFSLVDAVLGGDADTSLEIGADGLPIISYKDTTNNDLRVAHCVDHGCTAAALTTVDNSANNVGSFSSVAIGADGLPIISYYDFTTNDLKVLHCGNIACNGGAPTITVLDSVNDVGVYSSIAQGSDGLAVISYDDQTNHDLRVAHCSNVTCTAATLTAVDTAGIVGEFTSLAIGVDDVPVITYMDPVGKTLKVAHCANAACTGTTTFATFATGGSSGSTSVAIGTDGAPVIAYFDGSNLNLHYVDCANAACTSGITKVLDPTFLHGNMCSIAVGPDGVPLVSYYDNPDGFLELARPPAT